MSKSDAAKPTPLMEGWHVAADDNVDAPRVLAHNGRCIALCEESPEGELIAAHIARFNPQTTEAMVRALGKADESIKEAVRLGAFYAGHTYDFGQCLNEIAAALKLAEDQPWPTHRAPGQLAEIDLALAMLRQSRTLLRKAKCGNARDYVAAAIKSAQGARNHAYRAMSAADKYK